MRVCCLYECSSCAFDCLGAVKSAQIRHSSNLKHSITLQYRVHLTTIKLMQTPFGGTKNCDVPRTSTFSFDLGFLANFIPEGPVQVILIWFGSMCVCVCLGLESTTVQCKTNGRVQKSSRSQHIKMAQNRLWIARLFRRNDSFKSMRSLQIQMMDTGRRLSHLLSCDVHFPSNSSSLTCAVHFYLRYSKTTEMKDTPSTTRCDLQNKKITAKTLHHGSL